MTDLVPELLTTLNRRPRRTGLLRKFERTAGDEFQGVLSEARATTVRNYLVSRGLPSGAMYAQGVGSDQPVVECPGKQSAAVIACLQPNRRVELEVVGYKNQSGSD